MFVYLYFVVAVILYIIAIPILLVLSFLTKYKESIPSRFFLKNSKFKDDGIWFHSCSLGETASLAPFIKQSKYKVNISVITNTGYYEAKKNSNNSVRFLPYEIFLPFWINKQKVLIVLEAELWFLLFYIAKLRGIKTYLINARINTHSYNRYLKNRWFYKKIFANIDEVLAQTQEDKIRLESLGAKRVKVAGNIKLATKIKTTKELLKPSGLIITAGSTHKDEESLILNAFDKLSHENKKIIIVPRHPERFDKVDTIIKDFVLNSPYTYTRYSEDSSLTQDIILIDSLGELINLYAISDIVILGGAFEKIGGHNPLEPATFKCKIISGKEMFNQKALFKLVDNIVVCEKSELTHILENHDNIQQSYINSSLDMQVINESLSQYIKPL